MTHALGERKRERQRERERKCEKGIGRRIATNLPLWLISVLSPAAPTSTSTCTTAAADTSSFADSARPLAKTEPSGATLLRLSFGEKTSTEI